MASIPDNHPALYLSLTDAASAPLVSSTGTTPSNRPSHATASAQQILHSTSLATYTTARRLGLGRPLRVLVETADKGPVALHSYLNPPSLRTPKPQPDVSSGAEDFDETAIAGILASTRSGLHNIDGDAEDDQAEGHDRLVNGTGTQSEGITKQEYEEAEELHDPESGQEAEDSSESDDEQLSRLLTATVVTPNANHSKEARRAIGRLERLGTDFQRQTRKEAQEAARAGDGEDAPE